VYFIGVLYLFVKYLYLCNSNSGVKGKVASDCKDVKESNMWLALAKKLGVLKVVLVVQTIISLLYYFLHNLYKSLPFVTLGIPGAKAIW